MNSRPPRFFLRFLRWFCDPNIVSSVEGDLIELYHSKARSGSRRRADIAFALDVLLLFRPGIIRNFEISHQHNTSSMLSNYLKVGMRNLLRYRAFSAINVFGLTLAMSVSMLIILMMADQLRYDAFHSNGERVYRILSETETTRNPYATSPQPLAEEWQRSFSRYGEAVNLVPAIGGDGVANSKLADMRGYFTSPSFFSVFSFYLEEGDSKTALTKPFSMVITRATAEKLFGRSEVLGKTLDFSDRRLPFPQRSDADAAPAIPWGSFTVTGVIDETKFKSHITFDVLVSSSTMPSLVAGKKLEDMSANWDWYYKTYTFIRVHEKVSKGELDGALARMVSEKYGKRQLSDEVKGFHFTPQPLAEVQLSVCGNDTSIRFPMIGYYFLFFLVAVILVSACVNYTNLSIARSMTRAKEIGVRKVNGAARSALVTQFMTESVLTTLIALALALPLLMILRGAFLNLWINNYLRFDLPFTFDVFVIFVVFALVTGLLAGIFPSFRLASFNPVIVMKGAVLSQRKFGVRRLLIATQFVFSLLFITTSVLIFSQFRHYMNFDYGFESDGIVNVNLQGADYNKVATEFLRLKDVEVVSATDIIPALSTNNSMGVRLAGTKDYRLCPVIHTDENYLSNVRVRLLAGKQFQAGDPGNFVIVNARAALWFGVETPAAMIGQVIETEWSKEQLQVVGVAEDFTHHSLTHSHGIEPLIIRYNPARVQYANVRVTNAGVIPTLEEAWAAVDPLHPMKYERYDDALADMHQAILDVVSILGLLAGMAIVIACLGLLGIATYSTERRKKEVGIRKVFGADGWSITFLLSRDFLVLLGITILVGGPISYLVNNLWLQKLPHRVEFGWWILVSACSLLVVSGLITIGSQTWRAARQNPATVLQNS